MKKEKNNRGLWTLVVILILLVVGMGSYIIYDKVLSDKKVSSSEENSKNNEVSSSEENIKNNEKNNFFNYTFYNLDNLKIIENNFGNDLSENSNVIETIETEGEYKTYLMLNGDVRISCYGYADNQLLNIHKIVDIIHFPVAGPEDFQLIYMLDSDGCVYTYQVGNLKEQNYKVTKVDKVNNVQKLFISYAQSGDSGCWGLYAITANNECVLLQYEAV